MQGSIQEHENARYHSQQVWDKKLSSESNQRLKSGQMVIVIAGPHYNLTKRTSVPITVGLTTGVIFLIVMLVLILYSNPSSSDTAFQDRAGGVVEHKYTSLPGDLGDDVISISPAQSKTFNFTLDHNRDATGLMTGFIQVIRANMTGVSSVNVKIGSSTIPPYYHQFQLSDGEMKQIDFIIPNNGSVTFQNAGEREEQIMFNLQLTYYAAYRQ